MWVWVCVCVCVCVGVGVVVDVGVGVGVGVHALDIPNWNILFGQFTQTSEQYIMQKKTMHQNK